MNRVPLDPEVEAVSDLVVLPDLSAENLAEARATDFVEPPTLSDAVERVDHVYPGAPHGAAAFAGTEVARRYVDDQANWLRRQFARLG